MHVLKLSKDVCIIFGENQGKFPFSNSLLVKNVLIDAGIGIDLLKKIIDHVETLVLSHTHPDHCSGAWLFNQLGKRVLSPMGFGTDLNSLAMRFVGVELADYWKELWKSQIGMKSFFSEKYREGIISESPEIKAIKVSGHTKDMHVFLIQGQILYGADVDLTSFGPWYGNPESDFNEFRTSSKLLLRIEADVFVSSHGPPVFGKENIRRKIKEFFAVLDRREKKLLKVLAQPKTLEELVELSPLYKQKRFAKTLLDFYERIMIEKHLEDLIKRGKIAKIGDKFVALKDEG